MSYFAVKCLSGPLGSRSIDLFGELDLNAVEHLESALEQSLLSRPEVLVIDLCGTGFVCAAGYLAIGRHSTKVDRLIICCRGGLPRRMLQLLGYRGVDYVELSSPTAQVPNHLTIQTEYERERPLKVN